MDFNGLAANNSEYVFMDEHVRLEKDNGLMKIALETIRDMTLDITDGKGFIRDAEK